MRAFVSRRSTLTSSRLAGFRSAAPTALVRYEPGSRVARRRYLEDASIAEVMLNADGRLWIDRPSSGLMDTGETLSAADGERIVRLVAHQSPVPVGNLIRLAREAESRNASVS
jgi:hypothetical protein